MARIVTVTPNPAVDVSTSVERLTDAHKMRCEAPVVHPGGGGINVARVLHRLGTDVLAICPAGGPTGERLQLLLHHEGVPTKAIPIAGETRESFTAHVREDGRELRFVLPGPRLSPSEWQDCLNNLRHGQADWVVSSGSLPPGVPIEGHAQVAQLARGMGARMVLDSSGTALASALVEGVWLVKPSLRELSEFSGIELNTPALQRQAARELIAQGRAHMVALSLGDAGAMLVTADQCLQAQSLNVPVASSVGAGDSFLAALVWALDQQFSLQQALATAMAAGAAAVMGKGTALCQPQDLVKLRAQVQIEHC